MCPQHLVDGDVLVEARHLRGHDALRLGAIHARMRQVVADAGGRIDAAVGAPRRRTQPRTRGASLPPLGGNPAAARALAPQRPRRQGGGPGPRTPPGIETRDVEMEEEVQPLPTGRARRALAGARRRTVTHSPGAGPQAPMGACSVRSGASPARSAARSLGPRQRYAGAASQPASRSNRRVPFAPPPRWAGELVA